jgi:hypothetical protein
MINGYMNFGIKKIHVLLYDEQKKASYVLYF